MEQTKSHKHFTFEAFAFKTTFFFLGNFCACKDQDEVDFFLVKKKIRTKVDYIPNLEKKIRTSPAPGPPFDFLLRPVCLSLFLTYAVSFLYVFKSLTACWVEIS